MNPIDPKYGTDLRFKTHQNAIQAQLQTHGFGLKSVEESFHPGVGPYPTWEMSIVVTTKARRSTCPWAPRGSLAAFCEGLILHISKEWLEQQGKRVVILCPSLFASIERFSIDKHLNRLDLIRLTLLVSGREPVFQRQPKWI